MRAGILYANLSNYEPKSEFYILFLVVFKNLVRDGGDKKMESIHIYYGTASGQ